jgi:hypothetical protein
MTVPARNPLPLWIVVSVFLAAVVAVPLTCWMRTSPATPPPALTELTTIAELTTVLSQQAPELHTVPIVKNGSLERGFYLSTASRSWEQLGAVTRSARDAAKWQGVVYCEYVSNIMPVSEGDIQEWGEHGMQIGPFLFFGDPDLLRRIEQIIRAHSKSVESMRA